MEIISLLKGPAEMLAGKKKAFKNCLELATECLSNKDYCNAEMVYGSILADLDKSFMVEVLSLNDLDLFSLHTCFAYSRVAKDISNEEAMIVLNSLQSPIKLPLIPYLKAYLHLATDSYTAALEAINVCQQLLVKGYNFKPNNILNEEIVPELNESFMKLKLNGLRLACEILKSKDDNELMKTDFKSKFLTIGKLCETDFVKEAVVKAGAGKKEEKPAEKKKPAKKETGAVKKEDKQAPKTTQAIAIQTAVPKKSTNSVGVQTTEKNVNKELHSAILDIRNKVNNLQSKKDDEVKRLQKRNNELNEKLLAKDTKRTEFDFLKEKYLAMEKKLEQSQKQVENLQKLLVQQMQHKYQMQRNAYVVFEEKCIGKVDYLNEILEVLKPGFKISFHECKHEMMKWKSMLVKITGAKKDFENYYNSIDSLMSGGQYASIQLNNWPELPVVPINAQDLIHRYVRTAIETYNLNEISWPTTFERYKENSIWSYPNYNSNQFSYNYHTFNEDGRTTGSPHGMGEPQKRYKPPGFWDSLIAQKSQGVGQVVGHSDKIEVATPKKQDDIIIQETDQELHALLKANFGEVDEVSLLQVVYQIRDNNRGTLVGMSKTKFISDIKKALKREKKAKHGWNNISPNKWHNDHSENKCCICFEDFSPNNTYTLTCQHEFHKKCIMNWLKRQSACPVCRVHAVMDEEFPPLKA